MAKQATNSAVLCNTKRTNYSMFVLEEHISVFYLVGMDIQ